jgi:hypothetical protein
MHLANGRRKTVRNGRRTTVLLAPSGLEVVLSDRRGRVIRSTRSELDPSAWQEAWSSGLTVYDSLLAGALRELRVPAGCQTEILYTGAEEVVEIRSYSTSPRQAEQLAIATALGELSYDRSQAVAASTALPRNGRAEQQLVLVSLDKDERLIALFAWCSRAGLRPSHAVPIDAIVFTHLVETIGNSPLTEDRVFVYIGEYLTAMIAVGADEQGQQVVKFVRSFRLGFDSLTEALARALQREDHASDHAPLNYRVARQMLLRSGVPTRDQVVDADRAITGQTVLPLLMPVLQRYAVEARQTLRIGFAGSKRPALIAVGSGARIPGLADFLGNHLDVDIRICETSPREHAEVSCGEFSELRRWITSQHRVVKLAPSAIIAHRTTVHLSNAVRIGGLAAGVLLAMSIADAWKTHAGISQQIEAFQPQVERVRRVAEMEAQAAQLSSRMIKVEGALYQAIDNSPNWAAMLDEFSLLADDQVRLLLLATDMRDGAVQLELQGIAADGDGPEEASPISRFLTRLSQSPLVNNVRLESTRTSEFEGRPGKRFVIRAHAVTLPSPYVIGGSGKGTGS